MGVLKTFDGTDWRNVGCGDSADPGRLRLRLPDGSWIQESCGGGTPALVSSDAVRVDGSASTLTITLTSVLAGDLLIMIGWHVLPPMTTPSGWSEFIANSDGVGNTGAIYYKIADSGDVGSPSFTFTTNSSINSLMTGTGLAYRNASIADAAWNSQHTSFLTSTPFVAPSLTAPAGGGILIASYGSESSGAGAFSTPSGMTPVVSVYGANSSAATFAETVAAGATGTRTSTQATTQHDGAEYSLLLGGGPTGHPLKIEDPANPGTWITVGCFTPV